MLLARSDNLLRAEASPMPIYSVELEGRVRRLWPKYMRERLTVQTLLRQVIHAMIVKFVRHQLGVHS